MKQKTNAVGLPWNITEAFATIIDRAKKISTRKHEKNDPEDHYCPVTNVMGSETMVYVPHMDHGPREDSVIGPPGQEIEL